MDQFQEQAPQSGGESGEKQFVMPPKKNHTKFWVMAVLLILIVAAGWFLSKKAQENKFGTGSSGNGKNQPAYLEGMKVETYKKLPEGFPVEVFLENKNPERADILKYPDGRTDITVVYLSDSAMGDLVLVNALNLDKLGWQIKQNQAYENSAVILAEKDNTKLIVTLVPEKNQGTKVTFLYQK